MDARLRISPALYADDQTKKPGKLLGLEDKFWDANRTLIRTLIERCTWGELMSLDSIAYYDRGHVEEYVRDRFGQKTKSQE